jgi:hypothetical protein
MPLRLVFIDRPPWQLRERVESETMLFGFDLAENRSDLARSMGTWIVEQGKSTTGSL